MAKNGRNNADRQKKSFRIEEGKIYFSKQTERKFFFIMTIIMLIAGIFAKTGLF